MRINAHSNRRLIYKVMDLDGRELSKFYTWKVALAFAISMEGILIHKRTDSRMRSDITSKAA